MDNEEKLYDEWYSIEWWDEHATKYGILAQNLEKAIERAAYKVIGAVTVASIVIMIAAKHIF